MNNYDRFVAVGEKLKQLSDAGDAVASMRKGPGFPFRLEALQTGCSPQEKRELRLWEEDVQKDERRAVKVLFQDYLAVKAECEALLAAS